MTHDELNARIRPILTDHVKAAHAAVDVAINAVRLDDRERIAELERDLAACHADSGALNDACGTLDIVQVAPLVADLRANLNSLFKEADEARANLAQNAAITETLRAESKKRDEVLLWIAEQLRSGVAPMADVWWMSSGCTVLDAIGQVITVAGLAEGTPQAEKPPVVEEEQGPWVIRTARGHFESWSKDLFAADINDAMHIKSRAQAQAYVDLHMEGIPVEHLPVSVITLAEAHRIAGAK